MTNKAKIETVDRIEPLTRLERLEQVVQRAAESLMSAADSQQQEQVTHMDAFLSGMILSLYSVQRAIEGDFQCMGFFANANEEKVRDLIVKVYEISK